MSDFRTLNLAIEFYEATEKLGLHGHLRDQLSRASSSIALNLSEGNAKPSVKEKKRYYQTAYASCQECKTILRLAKVENPPTPAILDHLAASIYRLMNSKLNVIRNPQIEE
jgi:four helix bundle protein